MCVYPRQFVDVHVHVTDYCTDNQQHIRTFDRSEAEDAVRTCAQTAEALLV